MIFASFVVDYISDWQTLSFLKMQTATSSDETSMLSFSGVIMRMYRSDETITRSLESVKNQSYRSNELMIVDDGSIDDTAQLFMKI